MIHEKFKQQLETNKVVTEESLLEMKNKTYHNGDEVRVGDKVLFGMVAGKDNEGNVNLTMIMINENQIDLYESDEPYVRNDAYIPLIKMK